jgi:hypothetical protein
MTVITSTRE